jgi:hypothetical protein
MSIGIVDIARYCTTREVDLVLRRAEPPFVIRLLGEFDGYGDFFAIDVAEIEYLDLAGGITVAGMRLLDFSTARSLCSKWQALGDAYSGQSLVIWSDSDELEQASDSSRFLVVAGQVVCHRGKDWS